MFSFEHFSPEIRDIKTGVQRGRNEDSDFVLNAKTFFGF